MNTHQIHVLLEQYIRHNGRGNMIDANRTMVTIIEILADMVDRPCQCCGAVTDDEPSTIADADDVASEADAPPLKRKVGRPRKVTEPHTG